MAERPDGTAGITVPLASVDGVEEPPASTAVTVKKYRWPAARPVRVAVAPVIPLLAAALPSPPEVVPWNRL